jgi:hypothetical protein
MNLQIAPILKVVLELIFLSKLNIFSSSEYV